MTPGGRRSAAYPPGDRGDGDRTEPFGGWGRVQRGEDQAALRRLEVIDMWSEW